MIYLELFFEFFKIGLFTFGGAYAMIPLLKEVVTSKGWISEELFYDFIGVCESTPGPIAVNMATFVGTNQAGFLGGVVATFAVVLPSFIIILILAMFLSKVIKNKYFKRILKGINGVILGLILSTGILLLIKLLGYEEFSFHLNLESLIIFPLIVILYLVYYKLKKKKLDSVYLILFSALLGIIICSITNL